MAVTIRQVHAANPQHKLITRAVSETNRFVFAVTNFELIDPKASPDGKKKKLPKGREFVSTVHAQSPPQHDLHGY